MHNIYAAMLLFREALLHATMCWQSHSLWQSLDHSQLCLHVAWYLMSRGGGSHSFWPILVVLQ